MHASTDPVFVACWSTGPDPAADGVFFLEGLAWPAVGEVVALVPPTWMLPYRALAEGAPLARRLRDLGFPSVAPPPADVALPLLLERLAARPLILASGREEFLRRFRRALPQAALPVVLELESLAALLHPQRGERGFDALCRRFLLREPVGAARAADLRDLTLALVAAHFERPVPLRRLLARSLEELRRRCDAGEHAAAEWLELAARLLDRPSAYAGGAQAQLFSRRWHDGQFRDDLEAAPMEGARLLADVQPRFAVEYQEQFAAAEALQPRLETPAALAPADRQILQSFFDHLPKSFVRAGKEPSDRPGQRALAAALLAGLETDTFFLADAPTGTGKTLAYLAPLLLWSSAHGVRVAVSTYTRALQEQAYFREVPRALALLARAGLPAARVPRVSLLKGRANYICGRAIADAAPEAGAGSLAAAATWLRLALYYCEDPSADLDGFPLECGLPLTQPARALGGMRAAVDAVRALPQCCEGKAALRCAAGVRGLRAERSHLVVTNHAFVLSRPDTFGHVLFDECDHLHEATINARSFEIELDEVEAEAQRLLRGRGNDRAPLQRLARLMGRLAPGEATERLRQAAERAAQGAAALDAAVHEVARDLRVYREYRKQAGDALTPEEKAFLLHDYLESGRGDKLATSLRALRDALDLTDGALRTAIEELGSVPLRAARGLRWALRRPLHPFGHWREGLELWLGGEGEHQDFSQDFLYDAVDDPPRRKPMLSLKWLLPQQWLAETYYPALRWAGFVSATTRLRGGFKAMKGYLGLDAFEQETLERPARPVAEFAGPPTFDPAAALVCVPEDAPAYAPSGAGFAAWTEYLEEFLLFLAERTRGRLLGLFTNRMVLQRVAERLQPAFAQRGLTLYWQGMPGLGKEEIMQRFRAHVDSVLLGLDTFWYGVDFPGETCQYVVLTKLPYGVLDDYHYAQRARMGAGPHRNRVYLPKALAMFRQGCGRLLRSDEDRGVIFLLDRRVLERRHADFLAELPGGLDGFTRPEPLVADSNHCLQRAFAHMRLGAEIERRGLSFDFRAELRVPEPE
ncbi:MAG: ATP-dependent DNA helicase [Planctomycetota bacterium]|nr:MAG: ATP-dependent DNA helicase [Planctomycetota bacterium]